MLRDYQVESIEATEAAWARGVQRPAVVKATGLGKTHTFAELMYRAAEAGHPPVAFVHRDELVRQTVERLRAIDRRLRIGIIQGPNFGIARTDAVVASVQTLSRRLGMIPPNRFRRVVVDEAHHAVAPSYRACLEHFGCFDLDSGARALGVTATMGRGDGQGLGEIWEEVVLERGIAWGVEHGACPGCGRSSTVGRACLWCGGPGAASGYLVPAEVRTVRLAGLDTDRVRAGVDGDLASGALARAMSGAGAGPVIARAYSDLGRDHDGRLRRAIAFCPTVEIATAWTDDFRAVGARAAVVTGKTPTDERQAMYRALALGHLDVLASVMVLTEGWDVPAVEVAIMARPTKSMSLLTQCVGRVLRPSPRTGKAAALVIDVVGVLGSGLARTMDLSIPEPPESIAPSEPRESGERVPEPDVAIPEFEWVAVALDGTRLAAPPRKAGHAVKWLRTYGGTPFLPATQERDEILFASPLPGPDGSVRVWWRWTRAGGAEPLELAPGADIASLHAGVRRPPGFMKASDNQTRLLRRLRRPDGTPLLGPDDPRPSHAEAAELLDVHFASQRIDRVVHQATATRLVAGVFA